ATVTAEMELQVGEQLAAMFGFAVDESAEPCAWGHLTSGGTVANYESLWNLRAVKFYPIALQEAALACGIAQEPVGPAAKPLLEYSKWELLNLSIAETIELRRQVAAEVRATGDSERFDLLVRCVRGERIEGLGTAGFFLKHQDLKPPRVLVARPAHYSWEKAMKVLGLGTSELYYVQVDDHMRMDVGHLAERLEEAFAQQAPVLAVVGILGNTEFGTVDPIHEIVAERQRWRDRGCYFGIHVDGAWGGYLTSVFRRADGSFAAREEVAEGFEYFPGETVYNAFRALSEVDSITVDPHKLGAIPYTAGAFVARNREIVDFVAQKAAYVFDLGDVQHEEPRREKLHNLGQYILEGSKSGASAAAVHLTHRVLPLNEEGFGRLLAETVRNTEYFWDTARAVRDRLAGKVSLSVPFEPDSNLVCLLMNPHGNDALAVMNRFGRQVFEAMKVDPEQPLQIKEFIGSRTAIGKESLPARMSDRILEEVGIDPDTFRRVPRDTAREASSIFLLRHTLMSPWLRAPIVTLDDGTTQNYIDLYWEYLEQLIFAALEQR
ncbi:MAG: pyridoxal-dependent decarboxylase, partial [Acidobacteriota bacterium]